MNTKRTVYLPELPKSCHGCGTCAGVCPKHSIEMVHQGALGTYLPEVDPATCTGCGLCMQVCPNLDDSVFSKPDPARPQVSLFRQAEMDQQVFGKVRSQSEADILLGIRQQSGIGYAVDPQVRWRGASGGLVSALLLHLLKKGQIDGVLLAGFSGANSLPAARIARSPEEILQNQGSIYCTLPLNTLLSVAQKEKARLAVVCLPCQLHGLRLAQKRIPALRKYIPYVFTLFCSGNIGTEATQLLKKSVEASESREAKYRGDGWPGGFKSAVSEQPKKIIPFHAYFPWIRSFTPPSCLICWDAAGEFSDISFGDAWLPELSGDQQGISMFIARTDEGSALIREAVEESVIQIKELNDSDVLRARSAWKHKKQMRPLQRWLGKAWFGSVPRVEFQPFPGSDAKTMLRFLFWHTRCFLTSNSLTSGLVRYFILNILKSKVQSKSS